MNVLFTNGMIAVIEKSLLGEKLLRFCEMTAEEVLRALTESGFGGGERGDGESLTLGEERALDAFIREYAPSEAEKAYLLAPRDFHNAKALVKAELLHIDPEKLLAPDGMIPAAEIHSCIRERNYAALGKELGGAVQEALEAEDVAGAMLGGLFEKALYKRLSSACKYNRLLRKLLAGRADRVNILTAMRSKEEEFAASLYVGGGKLKRETLSRLFEAGEKAEHALDGTPYQDFYALCLRAKEKGLPFTEAERELESFEAEHFYAHRFELEHHQPFLYYVFRRRSEIANVRMILVCLNVGLEPREIEKRLRFM